ncbi:MAG: transposase family protein [Anaerolineae bacterium]|nr:transposase family protein [Phycisphaerae bacterium]
MIDEYTRRCLAIRVSRRFTGGDVIATLKGLTKLNQVAPDHVRCDNGPEFVSAAMRRWLKRSEIGALYIAPGSPWENAYAESYHSRLRDEMLNREEFQTLSQAQALLSNWRTEYNHERPHGSLGYQSPEAFATACLRRLAEPCSATLRPAQHDDEDKGKRLVESVAQ